MAIVAGILFWVLGIPLILKYIPPKSEQANPSPAVHDFPNNFLLGMHPFRAYNLVQDSQRFSDPELAHVINEFLETNIKLVSGDQNPQMRLEQFVLSIL